MKLAKYQREALVDIRDHGDPWHRMPKRGSARGHASAGISDLRKCGYATRSKAGRWRLTEKGEAELQEESCTT